MNDERPSLRVRRKNFNIRGPGVIRIIEQRSGLKKIKSFGREVQHLPLGGGRHVGTAGVQAVAWSP